MSGQEDVVTSPDQRKPGHPRFDRMGGLVAAALLLLLLLADHPNRIETAWVCGTSAVLLIAVAADWLLRRNGVRS
jgi:hypothetical protein